MADNFSQLLLRSELFSDIYLLKGISGENYTDMEQMIPENISVETIVIIITRR
jgi:hypothetical protein